MHSQKVLFICKRNEIYGSGLIYTRRSAGLYNSTRFIVESMLARNVNAHIVEVHDNNDIDREVALFRPNVVVLEALWVVPSKFPELMNLHQKVKWFVHLHSDMPFLSLEGIAMNWIIGCTSLGVGMIANSKESYDALSVIVAPEQICYLPNVYLSQFHRPRKALSAA